MDHPRKFRKRPLVVEALEWSGFNRDAVAAFLGDAAEFERVDGEDLVAIATLEGIMVARPGDWLIRGVAGEFYPCEPGVFATTYEPVRDEAEPE